MAYEALISTLLQEGEEKCAAIVQKARMQADQIHDDAEAAAESMSRQAEADVEREIVSRQKQIRNKAVLQAQRLLLQTKHEVLARVWQHAREQALRLRDSDRSLVLQRLLEELLAVVPSQPLRAAIHPREQAHLEPLLREKGIPLDIQPREDLLLGIEFVTNDAVLTSSLSSRLAKARSHLLVELNRLLFKEHPV